MKQTYHFQFLRVLHILAVGFLTCMPIAIHAQDIGVWEDERIDAGITRTRKLYLTAAPELKPAFEIQFYPRSKDSRSGNAAIHYLKAGGFFEQTRSLLAHEEFLQKQRDKVTEEGLEWGDLPPNSWRKMSPSKLPVDQVKDYLGLLSFQSGFMTDASKRQHCDFDRKIQQEENVYATLLPAVQQMRQLARNQSLRFKLAIAESRSEDATRIFGEQLMLGHHIGQDDFLVSGLVGLACVGIGVEDSYDLCELNGSQNIYWALASFPNPVVDAATLIETEFGFFDLMVPALGEIGITERQEDQCRQCVQQLTLFFDYVSYSQSSSRKSYLQFGMAGAIAASYPQAKQFLMEELGYAENELDSVSKLQVTLFGIAKIDEFIKTEYRKCLFSDSFSLGELAKAEEEEQKLVQQYSLLSLCTNTAMPAIQNVFAAVWRTQQRLKIRQTVESIRHHLATNSGQLPADLADLELAAPNDPVSQTPFEYSVDGNVAKLTAAQTPNIQVVIELHVKN